MNDSRLTSGFLTYAASKEPYPEGTILTLSQPHTGTVSGISADRAARELVFLAGPDDVWLLPDDDVHDHCAVSVAVDGARRVRLTRAERVSAAYRILTSGGSIRNVCLRLSLPEGTESRWFQLQCTAVSVISGIAVVVFAVNELVQQVTSLRGNMKNITAAVVTGLIGTVVFTATACGSSSPQPSVSACTKAYPAWFMASAAAGKTTPTPAECKGLTQDQVAAIAAKYLQSQSQ